MPKEKKSQEPQIVVNITPNPLPDAPAYTIDASTMTPNEMIAFKLAWRKLCEETGTQRFVLAIPRNVEFAALHTEHLRVLRKQIDDVLKGRGIE